MNATIPTVAAAAVLPRVISGFRMSWLIYGVAAYYGLKYLNKRGILVDQTGAALNLIDHGVDYAKSQLGIGHPQASTQESQNKSQYQ